MAANWGTQLKYGEYEIAGAKEGRPRLLGEGCFGKTYEGVRTHIVAGAAIREHVAVKVLDPAFLETDAERFRFIQELLALTKIEHPNLVRYIYCGDENGEVYDAMTLCRGGDLHRLVERFGALPEKVAALIGLQIAAGLHEIHQRHRLVHRDLKPSNIILFAELGRGTECRHLAFRFENEENLCRIADSGLVNFTLEADENPQRFVGSPLYASPEQIAEKPLDARSDLYSLGMILWHLVQGKGPFLDDAGEELADMAEAKRRHANPEEHEDRLPATLSPEFRSILSRLVAKHPDKRFSSAGELEGALREYLSRCSDDGEARFSVTRLGEPLDRMYELGQKIPSRWAEAAYAARAKKSGGCAVKLSIAGNTHQGKEAKTLEADAVRLGKLAELSRQPSVPEALRPVREVILATDLLAYTEDVVPHVALSDVLKARSAAKRPIHFSEATLLLRPIAEAFDFLLNHGQAEVCLASEEVWLTGATVAALALEPRAGGDMAVAAGPAVLTRPLGEWEGLGVRFSMLCAPWRRSDAGATKVGETMSASMQISEENLHPAPVFARLVYRIVNGSEVATAVQFTPNAYLPTVALGSASNNLLRDLVSGARPPDSVSEVLKELCANEGVLLRASEDVARIFQ